MQNVIRIPSQLLTLRNVNIKSLRAIRDVSLNGRSLDVDTVTATVVDESGRVLSVAHDAPVYIQRGGTRVGVCYLTSVVQIAAQTYTMQMVSPLGRLEQTGHAGGIYNEKNAADLITEICGGVSVVVEAPFDVATVSGWLPYVSPADESGAQSGTAKDNLMQVLFALNASLWADEDGVLHVGNLDRRTVRSFDADAIFLEGYEIESGAPVSQISITEHNFVAAAGETSVLFDGTASAGQRVVFSEPMHSLTPTGTITITESGANYAILGAGTGTLSGVPYSHVTQELTETVTVSAAPNRVSISDATLVSDIVTASAVMERLKAYYAHTQTIKADVLLEWERPGNVVSILDRFSGSMLSATIAAISPINYSQTLRGSIEALVGFAPWNEGDYEQQKVVLTGSGSFTVPDGVTTLTVVLIGGGGGGAAGGAGAKATRKGGGGAFDGYPGLAQNADIMRGLSSDPGAGGIGGIGGIGGKVLRAVITVAPGASISYACGAGGAGASAGGDQETRGTNGTHTTFGAYDSDDGDDMPYTDPGGATYAGDGDLGIAGGRGGGYATNEDGLRTDPIPMPAETVEFEGQTFYPGTQGDRVYMPIERGDGTWLYCADGSFGGGAAAGNNGSDGADAYPIEEVFSNYLAGGGNGADALPPAQAFYGRGGAGGNGGGGAGANGFWVRSTYFRDPYISDAKTVRDPGHGGAGSAGGQGGDGCVIVYYRTLNS